MCNHFICSTDNIGVVCRSVYRLHFASLTRTCVKYISTMLFNIFHEDLQNDFYRYIKVKVI